MCFCFVCCVSFCCLLSASIGTNSTMYKMIQHITHTITRYIYSTCEEINALSVHLCYLLLITFFFAFSFLFFRFFFSLILHFFRVAIFINRNRIIYILISVCACSSFSFHFVSLNNNCRQSVVHCFHVALARKKK